MMRHVLAALGALLVLTPMAGADTITLEFWGHANPEVVVDGLFNSIYADDEDIHGVLTFDGVLFDDLSTSYFAQQEYPNAHVGFALQRTVGGDVHTDHIETENVVEETYYADLFLVTNPAASSISLSNLDAEGEGGLFGGAFMQLFLDFDVEVKTLDDLLGGAFSQIQFTYHPGTTFVHRFYADVEIGLIGADAPEPSTMLLLGIGLGAWVTATKRHRRRGPGRSR